MFFLYRFDHTFHILFFYLLLIISFLSFLASSFPSLYIVYLTKIIYNLFIYNDKDRSTIE